VDQAKDKVDLTEEMIEEVEMTAEVAVVETEEAAAVETVAVRVVEEDKNQIYDLRFAISDFIGVAENNKNLILIRIEENQKSAI